MVQAGSMTSVMTAGMRKAMCLLCNASYVARAPKKVFGADGGICSGEDGRSNGPHRSQSITVRGAVRVVLNAKSHARVDK